MHEWTDDVSVAVDRALAYTRERLQAPKDPLWGAGYVDDLSSKLAGSVSSDGIGADAALQLFADVILPACRPNDGSNMLSYIPTAPTIESRMLDVVLGAVTIFGSHWEAGAGAIAAENEALSWLAGLAGLPATAGGCFVSGGSAANLSALVAARYSWRVKNGLHPKRRLRIAVTAEAHASIAACAHVMDVDPVVVPTDWSGRMLLEPLMRFLEADKVSPSIFAVVATGGTTATGVIDDLQGIADVCEEAGVWLHVDAAYGGAALCAASARSKFAGIERVNSFSVDPHKWFFAPYDCAALLYRQPEVAVAAHAQRANYLDAVDREKWNPSDYAFHLSRRARGLPFWFSLASNGTSSYEAAVEYTLDLANRFGEMVENAGHLRLVEPPELSIVLFERLGWTAAQYHEWSARLATQGTALVNPIVRNGETFARVCIVNPLTKIDLLASIIESMQDE